MSDKGPDCDCPLSPLPGKGLLAIETKDHVPDCPRVKWISDMVKEKIRTPEPLSDTGFIATPSMRDLQAVLRSIEDIRESIDNLGKHIKRLDDRLTYGD